jgi:predicted RNase H-like HicB family nuclease
MTNDFTAVYKLVEDGGFVAFAEELPGAIAQGETLEEARENLRDAIHLVLDTNREYNRLQNDGGKIIRQTITITR